MAECCSQLHCITLPDCCSQGRTYWTASDFTNGVLMNLIYTNGALRFPTHTQPFPYVYIACSWRGTIVKIDINSGAVLGEYYTSPAANTGNSDYNFHNYSNTQGSERNGPNPSRTTVDLRGNVWVANRTINKSGFGTIAQIGRTSCRERV